MKITRWRTTVVGLLVAALAAGCGLTGSGSSADYAHYADVDALFEQADLVIEGSVPERGKRRDIDIGGPGTDRYLVSAVAVTRVLKGAATVGDRVEVKQYATLEQGAEHLRADGRYLLFLETYPDFPGVPASPLNPTQSQYELDEAGVPTPLPGNEVRITRADLDRLAAG